MKNKTFDPTKPVQTRDGRPARIICTDRVGFATPLLALVKSVDSEKESVYAYYPDGTDRYFKKEDCSFDLVNVPERKSRWANVFSGGIGVAHLMKSDAIACRATYKEYQGFVEYLYEYDELVDVKYHKE